ncbi:hypothetical protein ABPG74_021961 [Tetrahymena malaccensis]
MNPNQLKFEETQDEGYSNSNQIIQSQSNDTKKTNKWTQKEDEALKKLVQSFGEKNWRKISGMMEGRSAIQCLHRWSKILKPGLVKGPWTAEEDEKLIYWVQQYGPYKWSQCSELITGRSGKQCRERWFNNLNPNVKKGNWTQEEDNAIFRGYLSHGSSWSKIAKNLEGRTENSVKNRFYSTVRKLLSDMEKKGKYVNQDNECDIKNIIQQSLSEYSTSQNMIKLLNEELDQDNQQRRKSSTTATNSASMQDCNEINMNLALQNQDPKEEHKESFQKLEIQDEQNINNQSNDIIHNLADDLPNQNQKNQISVQKNLNEKENLLQTSDNFQQGMEKDDIEKDQFQILNKDFPQTQQYENGNHEQMNRQNQEEKLQKQNNQISAVSPQNIMSQQQNQLLSQNPALQSQQLQIKLKDEYSQQNCLYRLILEGNVSIKKTTSMRDYSLYQKNKAKTRSKKYQKESSDDFKKNMQTDDASPSSQRSQDQFPLSFNAQHQLLQNGQSSKGNINYELSKEEKMMIQVQQFQNDIPQNQLKLFNDQMFIKQTISQQEQNNKNMKLQKKQMLSQLGKNSIQVQSGKNNNSNLSYLLKEKLMSINQLSKLKNGEKKRDDYESRDDDSLSQNSSEEHLDFQPKKSSSKQSIPTVLEQAQKLQKEIEEKQKQLLMLSLEGKVDKKKQKKGYQDQVDDSKQMQTETQQKMINVKEEYEDDECGFKKDKFEFKNNRKQQKLQKVQIDHEQQRQLLQKMLQKSQQNKKISNNEASSKEDNLSNSKLNNFNKKLQSQLKILDTLNALKLSNKLNKNYDSSESDDFNYNNQKSEGDDHQIDEEDEDDFNKNELDYDEDDDEDQEEEEDDDDDDDEDNYNDEEDDENGAGSKQISNKLMKYLSSSFAKLMHSITQKYSKKYQVAQQNKVNKKQAIKQQAHKQKNLDQIIQAQQQIQKNGHNLYPQKYTNSQQNQNTSQINKNQSRNGSSQIQQFEKSNNKKLKKDTTEQISQNENIIQNSLDNKLKQKQQIIEAKDKQQQNQINNADFNQQSLTSSSQQKYTKQDLNNQENQKQQQQQLSSMDVSNNKRQQAKKNKTQNAQNKQLPENMNELNKYNQNSQMEIENISLCSDKSVKLGQEAIIKDRNNNISSKQQKVDLNQKNSEYISHQQINQNLLQKDSEFSPSSQIQQTSSQENIKMSNSYPQIDVQSNPQSSQVSHKDQSSIYNGEMLNLSQESRDLGKSNQNDEKLKHQNLDTLIYNQSTPNSNNAIKTNTNSNKIQSKSIQNSNMNQANAFLSIMSKMPLDASKKSDDRIDYLINQLQSLETLLNTTKQELNKLESTIKEPEPNTQQNQSPTLLHNDEMSNMGILSSHNLNFINFNQYHQNNANLLMQQSYNLTDELDLSLINQQEYKQQNLKQLSKYHNSNSLNQKLHNNLMQSSFEGSSNHSHNMNQTQEEGKMHDNNQNHISDIHSMDFAFDNKYSNEDMNYIGGQEHEKDVYHLGNITPSPIKSQPFRHKDNNQQHDSSQNMQEKSVDDNTVNEEIESDNSYQNKKDPSKMASFKQII